MILNVTLKMILRSWWRNKVFFLVSVASLAWVGMYQSADDVFRT